MMNQNRLVFVLVGGVVFMGLIAVLVPVVQRYTAIAQAARQVGIYDSEAEARHALKNNPQDAMAYRTLSHQAGLHHDQINSLRYVEQAAKLEPSNRQTALDLAFQLYFSGRYQEAEAIATRLAVTPDETQIAPVQKYAQALLKKIRKKKSSGQVVHNP